MSAVAVVADSTCYLPSGWAREWGIGIVPVQVIVAGQAFDETEDAQAQRVADALSAWQPVTTSRPAPARFLQAYEEAREAGAESIVVATLSASLSATYESALIAAKEFDLPVHVVDTRTIAMGLGFAAVAGARAARAGASAEAVAEEVHRRAEGSTTLFYVDTLEYLRRGGRVNAVGALIGSALAVKPLLTITDGLVVPLEKVRTSGKAIARMETLAAEAAEQHASFDIGVQHLANAQVAEQLAERLAKRLGVDSVPVDEVGAVIGAHVGPGTVAVTVTPH